MNHCYEPVFISCQIKNIPIVTDKIGTAKCLFDVIKTSKNERQNYMSSGLSQTQAKR